MACYRFVCSHRGKRLKQLELNGAQFTYREALLGAKSSKDVCNALVDSDS